MTRSTTLVTLLAATLGLSACMSNEASMESDAQLETGVSNPDETGTTGDAVATPTDGIEDGPN